MLVNQGFVKFFKKSLKKVERIRVLKTLIRKISMDFSKRENWLDADSICMANGEAVARNYMFESKMDHQLFHELWNKYLGGMADILNYHLSSTGWVLLFRTRSEKSIVKAYRQLRQKSKKAKLNRTLVDVSRMISEHFRILLSQYVRRINAKKGRKGTLVMERFRKYVFHSEANYNKVFELICKQYEPSIQAPKYRAVEQKNQEDNEEEGVNSWKVGVKIQNGDFRVGCVNGTMWVTRLNSSVLRKYFNIHLAQEIIRPPT